MLIHSCTCTHSGTLVATILNGAYYNIKKWIKVFFLEFISEQEEIRFILKYKSIIIMNQIMYIGFVAADN